MTTIATIAVIAAIVALLLLDPDRNQRTSPGLWVPLAWLLIVCSRPVSLWLRAFGVHSAAIEFSGAEKYLDGSPVDRAVFGLLLLCGAVVVMGRMQQVGRLLRANWSILLFFAYCAVSVLWSPYPDVAFKRWVKAVGDLVMVVIILTEDRPLVAFKRLLMRIGVLLLPLSVLFIKYYPDLGRSYSRDWSPLYSGVATTKNELGFVCLVVGVGLLWFFITAWKDRAAPDRRRRLAVPGSLLVVAMWLLWRSNSMTAIACFLLASVLILAMELPAIRRSWAMVHFSVWTLIAVPFAALFLNFGSGVLESIGRNTTLTGRTGIWSMLLSIPGDSLLGTGFESFWLGTRLTTIWDTFGVQLNEAHNGYLEVFLNLGWAGVLLLGIVIATGYRNAAAELFRSPEGRLKLAYFAAALVYSFTEAGFRMMNPVWIFFLWAACAIPGPQMAKVRLVSLPRLHQHKFSFRRPARRCGTPEKVL